MHTWRFLMHSCVLQVLDRDIALMQAWLVDVAKVRPKECKMIIKALDEKCRKMFTV